MNTDENPPPKRLNRLYSSWVTDIDIDALIAGAAQAGGGPQSAGGAQSYGGATQFTVLPGLGSVAGSAGGSAGGSDDIVSKLERLQVLRSNGTLTDAEFESGKKMILGG